MQQDAFQLCSIDQMFEVRNYQKGVPFCDQIPNSPQSIHLDPLDKNLQFFSSVGIVTQVTREHGYDYPLRVSENLSNPQTSRVVFRCPRQNLASLFQVLEASKIVSYCSSYASELFCMEVLFLQFPFSSC